MLLEGLQRARICLDAGFLDNLLLLGIIVQLCNPSEKDSHHHSRSKTEFA